jgi:dTDP-4-dehydrorhamnose reductase
MKTPRSLIIGANGQVGAQLARLLGDRALATARTGTTPAVDLIACAHDPALAVKAIAEAGELDAVYCVGGATDVERCESDVAWAMDTNCNGPAAIARAARHLPFVYMSTDYVFDGEAGPYVETDATHALSVYGRSKLEGEQRVLEAHSCALVLRTTGVFGPDAQRKNFLYTLERVLQSGGTMRVPTDQLSNPTYNEDLAAATAALVAARATGIFHTGGPEVLSRFDFAQRAAAILGLDTTNLLGVTTAELNQKATRPLRSGLRIEKLNAALASTSAATPMRPLDDAIRAWKRAASA